MLCNFFELLFGLIYIRYIIGKLIFDVLFEVEVVVDEFIEMKCLVFLLGY